MLTCRGILLMLCILSQTRCAQAQEVDVRGPRPGLPNTTLLAVDQDNALAALDAAMAGFIGSQEIAGAVVLVGDERGPLALRSYGLANIEQTQAMADDSIFWIASMTKPITAACIMILQDEGKLSLDDPIAKHLPAMSQLMLDDGTPAVITIRQLLSHTSAMAELAPQESYTALNLEQAAERYCQVKVLFPPGSKWQYSQTSINTAGRIVEVVSGLSLDQFIEQRICQPLGMSDTAFYLSSEQHARLAQAYRRSDSGQLEPAEIYMLAGHHPTDTQRMPAANGGLFSTAPDYGKFCRMLLNEGQLDGTRILSAEAVKAMRTIVTGDLATGFTPGNGWGIGCCVVRDPQGVSEVLSSGSFGHGGAYGTQAWIDPVKQRFYVLMVQRANFPNADDSQVRRKFQELASQIPR